MTSRAAFPPLLLLTLALGTTPARAQTDPWVGEFALRESPLMGRVALRVQRSGRGYTVERRAEGLTLRGTARVSAGRLEVTYPAARGLVNVLLGTRPSPGRATYRRVRGRVFGVSRLPGGLMTRYELGEPATRARAPAALSGRLRVEGRVLRDPMGRDVLLRGVNVGLKRSPFLPVHDRAAVAALTEATGINFVRFSVAWRAIEPSPLAYDADYLQRVTEAIATWTDAGVYVLVDMHQDMWGGTLAPHGAPEWATLGRGTPLELPAGAPWQARYLDPRCYGSFEALWGNAPVPSTGLGLQEHYARAWAQLASRLRGVDGVVGYDLINEPFYGNEITWGLARVSLATLRRLADWRLARDLALGGLRSAIGDEEWRAVLMAELLTHARRPDVFDGLARALAGASRRCEARLSRFYQRVGSATRRVDPGRPLFLEPLSVAGIGVPSQLPAPGLDQLVYAPHLYDPFVDSGLGNDGDLSRVRRSLQRSAASARRLGWPLVFGEWGNVHAPGEDLRAYANQNGALIDGVLAGSAYWDHVPGRETNPAFQAAMRPYPRRVAGTLRAIEWDSASRRFTVRYRARGLDHPTVIQVHRTAYPSGVRVDVDDPWSQHRVEGDRVLIWSPRSATVRVTLRPR